MKKVILAESAGFCFGVQRAVEEAIKTQEKFKKKIYTLGPLIHNNDVVKYLESNNIFAISLDNINTLNKDDVVLIRSHGVSKNTIDVLSSKGLIVINATCPFVTNIQKKVNQYSGEGYKIVILGDKEHPEVTGINGWCNNEAIITNNGTFEELLPNKICVVSQTTEKAENWEKTLSNLSNITKELLAFNTICSATEVRQKSVAKLSKEVDWMIIIGGKNSSNTTKLYQIAKENCENTIHIENSNELTNEIYSNNYETIGVSAGASTPDWVIDEVVSKLKGEK